MKTFTKQYTIKASLDSVWNALTDSEIMKEWVGEKVTMGTNVGDQFSLWNNSIYGTNTEVTKKKKLVQDWYGGKWANPSKVTFELKEVNDTVIVDLLHENLPNDEADSFNSGWDEFYMGPLKEFCESKA